VVDVRFGRVTLIRYKGREDSFMMNLRNPIRLLTHQKNQSLKFQRRYRVRLVMDLIYHILLLYQIIDIDKT